MSTINPLFLDSTKPIGDKVVTNVELLSFELKDGEALFFEFTDDFGFLQRFALKSLVTKKSKKYVTELWLKYQFEISYRFVLEVGGKSSARTLIRKTRAGHVISEKWQEDLGEDPWESKLEKKASPKADSPKKDPTLAPTIKNKATGALGKSNFLGQLKYLIDDLL